MFSRRIVYLVKGTSEPSTPAGFFCSYSLLTCSREQREGRKSGKYWNNTWSKITFLLLFHFFATHPRDYLFAQRATDGESRYEVNKIEFEGNETLGDNVLLSVMTTKESPSRISAFLYEHISERLGSKHEYFDPVTFDADLANLKGLYRDNGFFGTAIDTSLIYDQSEQAISLKLIIHEGQRSLVDTLRCLGLEGIQSSIRDEIFSGGLVVDGSPFDARSLIREQERILILLYNHGYPGAKLDSAVVQRRLSTNNLTIILAFTPGRQYTIGKITITGEGGTIDDIDEGLVFRYLDLEAGQFYSLEKKLQSERSLSRTGIFESVRVDAHFPARDDTSRTVPISIVLKPRDKHELTPELFVNDEDNAFNLGLGLGYNNRNFFGSARNFLTRGSLRVQSIQRVSVLKMFTPDGFRQPSLVAKAELTFQLMQPYIFSKSVSGNWTFSLIADKRKPYLQSIVRNRMGISKQFSEHTYGLFDWSLERMSVEIFDSTSATRFTGEQRPQLNSIFVATVQRDMTNDIISPSAGLFVSISLEEGGIIPSLLKNFGSSLPFSQYYKASAFARWYKDLSKDRFAILAMKLKGGFSEPYRFQRKAGEENLPIPINRRFFAGGSGSVRGWRTRELGAVERPQFGGNAALESSIETRINILRGLGDLWYFRLNGIWTVFFLDVGNVWANVRDVSLNQLAIASGFGIRYDTIFGPVRVDFGFRLYDPLEKENHRWFTSKRFWKETFADGVLHFGIGHAF